MIEGRERDGEMGDDARREGRVKIGVSYTKEGEKDSKKQEVGIGKRSGV